MKPPSAGMTTTGVRKSLPERRPRCSITPYNGNTRVPAKRMETRLNRRAAPSMGLLERAARCGRECAIDMGFESVPFWFWWMLRSKPQQSFEVTEDLVRQLGLKARNRRQAQAPDRHDHQGRQVVGRE